MWCLCLLWFGFGVVMFQEEVETQYNYHNRRYSVYRRPVNPYWLDTSGSSLSQDILLRKKPEKVHLDVYYETNCPDSMRFITDQLYPVYQDMKEVLKINLIPYGKASATYNEVSGRYDFNCHHGPAECYGNTVQSCAISLYPHSEDHLNLINCMEKYPRPSSSGEKCARRLSMDWKKISKCADGEEGNRLLHTNSKRTEELSPRLHFVPWIVVDKVYTSENQRKSLRNLKQVVCDRINNQHSKCSRRA